MLEICSFLTVSYKNEVAGTVVEECASFNEALRDFTLVLEPHQIPQIKEWIMTNVTNMQEHCIKMLDAEPASTFKYLLSVNKIDSATEQFVNDAGGSIQQFIDAHTGHKAQEIPAEVELTEESEDTDAEAVSEAFVAQVEEEAKAITEQENTTEPHLTPLPGYLQPGAPRQSVKVYQTEEVIHKRVRNVIDYDPDLIDEINDGDIAASIEKLKLLNARIALGGLDPALVLSDEDLEIVYKKLSAYPAALFKSFMLAYLKSVNSETERFRVSAVIDDLVHFISGGDH